MMKRFNVIMMCFAALGLFLASCSNEEKETAGYSFSLVDAPGDYQEVNIDVQGLEIQLDGETIVLDVEPAVYNLLELTGGVSASLAEGEFPAGQINQIRLILGEENSLVVEGETEPVVYDLKTPSAQQSGLKLKVSKDLEAGVQYNFILDFNVNKSVVKRGATESYLLKPVIRVTTLAETGAISGTVSAEEKTLVTATSTTDTISSYTNESTGEFLLYAVPEGTYELSVGEIVSHENVEVVTGETTGLGDIELQ